MALEAALAQEREKAEQERNKLTAEVVSLINTMVDAQHGRWSMAVGNVKQDLSASRSRVQGGFQLVSKGLDNWAEREGGFSKTLLGNKDEVKKSIQLASKVQCCDIYLTLRLLISAELQSKRVPDEFMLKPSSLWILK